MRMWASVVMGSSGLVGVGLFTYFHGSQIKDVSNQSGIFQGICCLELARFIFSLGQFNFRKDVMRLIEIAKNDSNSESSSKRLLPKNVYTKHVNACSIAMAISSGIGAFLVYKNIAPNVGTSIINGISLNNENYVTKYVNYVETLHLLVSLTVLVNRHLTGYDEIYENAKPYVSLFDFFGTYKNENEKQSNDKLRNPQIVG